MTMEQRMDQLEKRNKRLTVALTMTVVAMAAVVTMAATGLKDGNFDTVTARTISAENDAGDTLVTLSANFIGGGLVKLYSAKGKGLVMLAATLDGEGTVETFTATANQRLEVIQGAAPVEASSSP